MAGTTKLRLEQLEDRLAPATFGVPWPNPGHLTLSFAPDGTQVGQQQSQLFKTLDAVAPRPAWQMAIVQAFQTWAAQTNINLSVVPDSGAPLGTVGPLQGDSRFGDIRITAVPLPADVLGVAIPFDVTAGSWAGDVELNSNDPFGVGGSGLYDLFSVALHEAGHALSLDGNADPTSVMYDAFTGTRLGLSTADVAAIQSLYGTRAADPFDAAKSNGSFSTATSLNMSLGGNGSGPTVVDANIASPADVDVYTFKPGQNQTGLTFLVQTRGISLLAPRLTVYSQSQAVLASVASADPLHGNVSVHLSNLTVGATYYIKVAPTFAGAFGAGSYRLQVVPDGATPVATKPAGSAVVLSNDAHTNDTLGKATDLRQTIFQADSRYAYAAQAAVTDAADVDFYHFRTPQAPNGATTTVRVLVWGTEVGGLDPSATVYDTHGNALPAEVLVNENGSTVIQVAGALPNTDYYVAVRAERPSGAHNVGSYFLGIGFTPTPVGLQTFAGGTLTAAAPDDFRGLQVTQSQLFHFALSADSGQAPVGTAVKMTIYDQLGNVVTSLTALNGETQTLTVFLAPGLYTVRFAGATNDGSPLPATRYVLRGLGLSDPIGPATVDPTLTVISDTSQPDLTYTWIMYGYFDSLVFSDPSGYPAGF